MKKLLKSLADVEKAIANKFGLEELWHNLIDCTDIKFVFDIQPDVVDVLSSAEIEAISEVSYGYESLEDLREGNYYSIEVYGTSVWQSDCGEYFLVVGDNAGENRDMYLFARENLTQEGYAEI